MTKADWERHAHVIERGDAMDRLMVVHDNRARPSRTQRLAATNANGVMGCMGEDSQIVRELRENRVWSRFGRT